MALKWMKDMLVDDPVEAVEHHELDHAHDHAVNRSLDRIVSAVQSMSNAIGYVHPYLLFIDLATLLAGGMGVLFALQLDVVEPWRMGLLWLLVSVGHEFFQLAKGRLTGERSRHYMRDITAYWLPSFLCVGFLVGVPLRVTLDYFGLYLALWCGIVRLGCFIGGCCFGRACASLGVLYRKEQLYGSDKPLRRFRPGPFLGKRVFPLQLVAAAVNLSLFAGLWWYLTTAESLSGSGFFLYMVLYAPYRFLAEYARGDRERKSTLTRTQRLLIPYFATSVALLAFGVV